ncbi:hypothetical protein KC350_g75 [Hortaea werneckii]|nr:hypothetical protein KC350_g75 [Hortaea werneckii]
MRIANPRPTATRQDRQHLKLEPLAQWDSRCQCRWNVHLLVVSSEQSAPPTNFDLSKAEASCQIRHIGKHTSDRVSAATTPREIDEILARFLSRPSCALDLLCCLWSEENGIETVRLRAPIILLLPSRYALVLYLKPLFATTYAITIAELMPKREEVFLYEGYKAVQGTIMRIEHDLCQSRDLCCSVPAIRAVHKYVAASETDSSCDLFGAFKQASVLGNQNWQSSQPPSRARLA